MVSFMRPFISLLAFLFMLASAAKAQDYAPRYPLKDVVPSITTTGIASAEVAPDIAIIALGIMTERPKATDAAHENALAAQAVVAEIKAQGIDPKDIRTVSVSLSPVYDDGRPDEGGRPQRILRGYLARNELSVRLRQIDKAGAFAARWIERGANRIESITFDYEQKDVKLEALRVEAVRDALRRATSYTSGLGIRLGRVISITPTGAQPRHPAALQMARAAATQDAMPAIPIEPGVETLQVMVDVTWELAQ
jgi:uncharacterized protein YggE